MAYRPTVRTADLYSANQSSILCTPTKWLSSSVCRATPLHGEGRRFESYEGHHYRGVEQWSARMAHNHQVGGSSPPPATIMHGYKVQIALIRLSRWARYPYVRPTRLPSSIGQSICLRNRRLKVQVLRWPPNMGLSYNG